MTTPPYLNDPWHRELREKLRDREARRGYCDWPPAVGYLDAAEWYPSTVAGRRAVIRVVDAKPEPDPELVQAVNAARLSLDEAFAVMFVATYNCYSAKGRGTPDGLQLREIGGMLDWARRYEPEYRARRPARRWLTEDAIQKILERAYGKLTSTVGKIRTPRRSRAARRIRVRPPAILTVLFSEIEDLLHASGSGRRRDRRAFEDEIRRRSR